MSVGLKLLTFAFHFTIPVMLRPLPTVTHYQEPNFYDLKMYKTWHLWWQKNLPKLPKSLKKYYTFPITVPTLHFRPVSYTHLDVYKRQVLNYCIYYILVLTQLPSVIFHKSVSPNSRLWCSGPKPHACKCGTSYWSVLNYCIYYILVLTQLPSVIFPKSVSPNSRLWYSGPKPHACKCGTSYWLSLIHI